MNSNKDAETQNFVSGPKEKTNIKRIFEFFTKTNEKARCSKLFSDGASYKNSVKSLWIELKNHIVGGSVTAVVAIAACLTVNLLGWNLGYEVYVDGENIGMVTERDMVFDAIEDAKNNVKVCLGDDAVYEKEPIFVRRIVSDNEIATIESLKRGLLSNVDSLAEGYALYIDGEQVFGFLNEGDAELALAQHKENIIGEISDGMTVDFCEEIEIKKEFIGLGKITTPEGAAAALGKSKKVPVEYTVQETDTISGIARKFNTEVEQILAMNDMLDDGISAGMKLNMEKAVPLVSVKCVQTVALTEPVPYKIEKIEDDSVYEGRTVVSRKGQDGSANVLATVTTINGVETDKKVISSETVTEPVTQIEKIGTKERPATTGSGEFTNPSAGTLSSRYGLRWDRSHNGIDICGAHNSDIKAADGGLVTYASWMDGYGNYVIIDHENGYQTAYAHCESLLVSVGDRVAKGEVIAKMGSTGRSTGTHLHFEVKKDGQFVNPLDYVGY